MGLQLAVLYAPRAPAVDTGGFPLDKVIHVAVFLLPTVALARAGMPRSWAIGLMAAHAPVSELIQHVLLPDRSGEPLDVLADLTGVALGALLIRPRRAEGVRPVAPEVERRAA